MLIELSTDVFCNNRFLKMSKRVRYNNFCSSGWDNGGNVRRVRRYCCKQSGVWYVVAPSACRRVLESSSI